MFANYHTHTYRCQHATGEDREYVEAAIRGGMKVLGFSDHSPWIYKDNYVSKIRMAPNEVDGYIYSLQSLKKEYEKDITIYIGFESEYIPELIEAQNAFLKDYPIDYMILGQHMNTPEPHGTYTGFPTSSDAFLAEYVDTIIEGMETGKYRYVAHPDLINYTGSDTFYREQMTKLCKYLKEKDVPVELNLLGVYEKRHYTSKRFLDIAKAVGNSIILGIDAHTPDRLECTDIQEECIQIIKDTGLEYVKELDGLGE